MQLRTGGRVKAALADLAVEFILDLVQQGSLFAEDLFLNIDEPIEILVELVGVFRHQSGERFAGHIFGADRPFAVDDTDFKELRNIQPRFLDARLIQRFVQDLGLAEIAVEYLEDGVAVLVDDLGASLRYNLIIQVAHGEPP